MFAMKKARAGSIVLVLRITISSFMDGWVLLIDSSKGLNTISNMVG